MLVSNAAVFDGGLIREITEEVPNLEKAEGRGINTCSSTSILGKKGAIPCSSTKGALNVLARSLALGLAERGGRVNAAMPGSLWTPAIATSDKERVESFGSLAMAGAGQRSRSRRLTVPRR